MGANDLRGRRYQFKKILLKRIVQMKSERDLSKGALTMQRGKVSNAKRGVKIPLGTYNFQNEKLSV